MCVKLNINTLFNCITQYSKWKRESQALFMTEYFILNKVSQILTKKEISIRKMSTSLDYDTNNLYKILKGERNFSKELIVKISPILEVSENEIKSWILVDKYPKTILEKAHIFKLAKGKSKELIITGKIDELLEKQGLTRTQLSKLIKYSQSGLNAMIIGKKSFSKSVMLRISEYLNIPFEELQAWWVADRYSLEVLSLSLKVPEN